MTIRQYWLVKTKLNKLSDRSEMPSKSHYGNLKKKFFTKYLMEISTD